ncbi:ABC transporter permease [Streptomyces sp. NPDC006367]|uniref:ABC transporter permease n=1 Tax=unclassified Streptomyces TaxID=2593676 RepID=UPI0033AA7798
MAAAPNPAAPAGAPPAGTPAPAAGARRAGTDPRPAARPWTAFLVRRLTGLLAVLVTLVTVTFLLVQLVPGDPARAVAGTDATPAEIALLRHEMGLDKPLAEQFTSYVGGLLRGDLGTSFQTRQPVVDVIAERLPFTAQLAFLSIAVVLAVSVPLGMAWAVATRGGRRPRLNHTLTFVTGLVSAVPEYVLGTLLVLVLAVWAPLLPAAGAASLSAMVLPVTAIALPGACVMARVVRRETAGVLEQDYLRTARGKRLPGTLLHTRHALPNLLTGTLTLGGLSLVALLGGTVVVESVFAWPGIGTRVVQAILSRDYPVVQGIVLVLGLLAAVVNLLVDVLLGLLDPRTLTGRND